MFPPPLLLHPPMKIASAIRLEAKMIWPGKVFAGVIVWGIFDLLKNLSAQIDEVVK